MEEFVFLAGSCFPLPPDADGTTVYPNTEKGL
jgi:hypothetical protein